jgi:hypothetical protein
MFICLYTYVYLCLHIYYIYTYIYVYTFHFHLYRHPYSEVIEVKRNSGVLIKQSSFVSRDYELGDLIAEEVQINPFITALHILIVDDSRLNRKMVSKFLKGDDYLCDEAEDGLEAIRMVKENFDKFERSEIRKPYHAILMDYTVRGSQDMVMWILICILISIVVCVCV